VPGHHPSPPFHYAVSEREVADRPLQLLDDSAQELHDATWSVDNPDLAAIREEKGSVILHAKRVGTVVVSASWGGETRTRDIKIWSALRSLPPGTTNWGTDPIGLGIGDLPAVPAADGPATYSLEQTSDSRTYPRAVRNDGIEVWTWLMPEQTRDVELICGDWLGGALISASRAGSSTLYAVAKDRELRWQRGMKGVRRGLADSTDHLVHVLNQSPDGNTAMVLGLDEKTGTKWFELAVPESSEKQTNLRRQGSRIDCAQGSISERTPTKTGRLMVNMDGYGYLAFAQNEGTRASEKCALGHAVDPKDVILTRDDKLMLWKIDPDGSYRATVVGVTKTRQLLSAPRSVVSPTNAVVTDNMNGTLIPVRVSHDVTSDDANEPAEGFVYRLNQDGELLYKFPLPTYSGTLKDDMVIGEDNVAFATRGSVLIAFNLISRKELWRWQSNEPEISVFAALANGACLVLMEVANSNNTKVVFSGKAMMDWEGNMYKEAQLRWAC
jgi:hypothetical protein